MKTAVLIMAYGTPSSMEDMSAYLSDVREGRTPSPELVAEMKHRYELIGKSPLNELTQAQAQAIENELKRQGHDWKTYVGMRHWSPRIKTAVDQMKADGVTDAVAMVMAPHYSSLSIGRYQKKVEEAGSGIRFKFVHSWWEQPQFLQALEEKVQQGLKKFPTSARIKIVFTAHSLPTRILKMGDPYDQQLKDNANVMAKRLGLTDWTFAYQSAGATAEPWLGPPLEEVIPDLAKQGYQHVFVAPIGFVCDHVEILYDLDIEAQKIAKEHNIHLERTESMNTTSSFIEAAAHAIADRFNQP